MDKKWMLKSYVGKKILQIMEKTTVDFISVVSSVTTVFLFWNVSGDVRCWPCLTLGTQFETPRDLLSPSLVNLIALHSAVRLKSQRAGQNPCWGQGYCFPSGCCCSYGSGLPEQDDCCYMGDDAAPGFLRLLSQFCPQSLCPQSLLRHL